MTLKDVVEGVDKKIKVRKLVLKRGVSYSTCTNCNGTGQVITLKHTILGQMQTSTTCLTCNGTGKKIEKKPPGS